MSIEIHPENARARALYQPGNVWTNTPPHIVDAVERVRQAEKLLDAMVQNEFPLGCVVTVEDVYHGGRFIRGPVVGHVEASKYCGACLLVKNRTGKTRRVSIHNFIFKEAADHDQA